MLITITPETIGERAKRESAEHHPKSNWDSFILRFSLSLYRAEQGAGFHPELSGNFLKLVLRMKGP